jgi:hypothetical protein
MLKYGYYLLTILYSLFLLYALFNYVTKQAPTGDASVDWARGIFFSIGLLVILVVGWLFRRKPTIGFIILCLPLVYVALPLIRSLVRDMYASAPTLKTIPPLTLTIQNTTKATVHVQLSCWFNTSQKGQVSLYKTLDYTMAPLKSEDFTFEQYETNLLASKSRYITIMMYEQVKMNYNGVSYDKEIQPCMQFYDEQIEAFSQGHYTVVIDSTKNSPTFRSTVELLKAQDDYGTGVF